MVVRQLLFTQHKFPHFAGYGLDQCQGLFLMPAGHAALGKGLVSAARATLCLVLIFFLAHLLVELCAHIKGRQAVEKYVFKVVGKPLNVAAVVQQQAVHFPRIR